MRAAVSTAIPGVVEGGRQWTLVWSGNETADGLITAQDHSVWFAQEQTSTVIRLGADDQASVVLKNTHGAGSLAIDSEGRVLAVERTCTDPGLHSPQCAEPTTVAVLSPKPQALAQSFSNGKGLGRLNDLTSDGRGGAYFTVGGAYRVNAKGVVSVVVEAEDVHTNGIALSPDKKTLYVTNGATILAFDVARDGATSHRRDFAKLEPGDAADGMAVDREGRLYVSSVAGAWGVYVFDLHGARLGFIPTPRRAISLTFAGGDRKMLYVATMGALDPDGKEHTVPEGVRNTAMTVYRAPVLAAGLAGRSK
jgi:gluconolactonase